MQTIICRGCGIEKPISQYYKSCLDRHNYRCKFCKKEAVKNHLKRDPINNIKKLFGRRIRNSGLGKSKRKRLADMRTIRSIYDGNRRRCAITGETDATKLTIVPYWRSLPLDAWNCVLVTKRLASPLGSEKNQRKYHEHFPPDICREMIVRRYCREKKKDQTFDAITLAPIQ